MEYKALQKCLGPETAPPKIERAPWHVRISWSINRLESSWGPKAASLWKKVFGGSKNKGKKALWERSKIRHPDAGVFIALRPGISDADALTYFGQNIISSR
ncbi:uncharacterized protein PAC_18609 [Phialocephala subalpina]|uniref:Uncharacterized protein n=1 Tax=Phialocephala subalpina TaxID=576137 RepID=A0A1L7XUL3_9HELO|nr:uncharacterized protein PAC_18609 [Phialocephala subalpina]